MKQHPLFFWSSLTTFYLLLLTLTARYLLQSSTKCCYTLFCSLYWLDYHDIAKPNSFCFLYCSF
uniref:Uncharacterized protein n=1 Tax=Arundo donax TaxID=35708 RepID=A0A0A9B3D1_ARUDO